MSLQRTLTKQMAVAGLLKTCWKHLWIATLMQGKAGPAGV